MFLYEFLFCRSKTWPAKRNFSLISAIRRFFPPVPPAFAGLQSESATAIACRGRFRITSVHPELTWVLSNRSSHPKAIFFFYNSARAQTKEWVVPALRHRLSPRLYPVFRGCSSAAMDRDCSAHTLFRGLP